mmetsp:Transcript_41899/g.76132  ORF Transcript_41899/g.76132 Transcript_41899/m.76132 type:complete len:479 (-) Transcript_41899:77-1513(-)
MQMNQMNQMNPGRSLGQFSKTKMCKFHLMGKCTKGDDCLFAHEKTEMRPLPDLTCTKLCKALIQTGVCTLPDCKYAHNKEELRSTSSFHKTKMCRFALMGHCALGDKCNFAHTSEEIRELDPDELLEDDFQDEWNQQQEAMMQNMRADINAGQPQAMYGLGNNGSRGRPGAMSWLGGLLPANYAPGSNAPVAVPYRTLGDEGSQGLLVGQGNVFMLGMPAVAANGIIPDPDFNKQTPPPPLPATTDLSRRRGNAKTKNQPMGTGAEGRSRQVPQIPRTYVADPLKEVQLKGQNQARVEQPAPPPAPKKEQSVITAPLVDDPIITMGDGDAAAGGRHGENTFRAAPGPAMVPAVQPPLPRVPTAGYTPDSDLAGGVGQVVGSLATDRNSGSTSRMNSSDPSDTPERKYSSGSPSSPSQEVYTGAFLEPAGPAYVKKVEKVNGLVVKNTFLDFTPQSQPIRLVRTAEGALCSMGDDDEEE